MPGHDVPLFETADAEVGPDGAPLAPRARRKRRRPASTPRGTSTTRSAICSRGSTPCSARRSSTPRGRCWSSPAPGRARPGCSPTASPTSSDDHGVSPVRDPGHHVHQQGRRRDEAPGRRAGRPGRPEDVGVDVPLGVRAHPAPRRRPRSATRRRSRSTTRPTPCASPATSSATSTSTPSGSRPARVHATISAAKNDGVDVDDVRRAGRRSSSSARSPTSTASTRPACCGPAPWTSTTCSAVTVELFREHPDVLEHYQQPLPARARRRVPGHQPGPERARAAARPPSTATSASSATATSRSTVPRRRHPQHPRVRGRRSPTPPSIVLEQNYRSTQTILDAANAVIANNLGRKPKELWTEQGDGEPIVRYHADDEHDEAAVGRPRDRAACTTTATYRWGDIAVFYRTNAQSRVLEEQLMRAGIPYKVVGGTRFYDRREVKDALAYLRAVVNPVDEVCVKRVLNVPKRGVGDTHRRPARRLGHAPTALPFIDALRRRRRGRASAGRAVRGIDAFLDAARRARRPGRRRARPRCSRRSLERTRLPRRARGRAHRSRPRAGSRTWPSWSASAQRVRDRRRVPRAGQPGRRHRRARRRRLVGRAHDAALGQGPRVPGRVPHRAGGRRVPAPALARRARRARGGAPPRLRRHHPGPASGSTSPTPGAARCSARPSTTRRAGSSTRSPPSWSSEVEGSRGPAAAALGGGGWRRRRRSGGDGRRPGVGGRDRIVERRCRRRPRSRRRRSGAEALGLRVGDDVRHTKFGEGVILDIERQRRQGRGASCASPSVGEKRLLLSWAPLESRAAEARRERHLGAHAPVPSSGGIVTIRWRSCVEGNVTPLVTV